MGEQGKERKESKGGKASLLAWFREFQEKRRLPMKEAKMNMTPMIDVVFLLIIFFMVVSELVKLDIEPVTLPWASEAKEDSNPPKDRIIVNVKADPKGVDHGTIWVNHKLLSPAKFQAKLHEQRIRSGKDEEGLWKVSVKIRGDKDVEWKYIQNIMVACMRERVWRVSFGAKPRETLNY